MNRFSLILTFLLISITFFSCLETTEPIMPNDSMVGDMQVIESFAVGTVDNLDFDSIYINCDDVRLNTIRSTWDATNYFRYMHSYTYSVASNTEIQLSFHIHDSIPRPSKITYDVIKNYIENHSEKVLLQMAIIKDNITYQNYSPYTQDINFFIAMNDIIAEDEEYALSIRKESEVFECYGSVPIILDIRYKGKLKTPDLTNELSVDNFSTELYLIEM